LDFLISPALAFQAFSHGKSAFILLPSAYSYIWNVLDMVSGIFPVTVVR